MQWLGVDVFPFQHWTSLSNNASDLARLNGMHLPGILKLIYGKETITLLDFRKENSSDMIQQLNQSK